MGGYVAAVCVCVCVCVCVREKARGEGESASPLPRTWHPHASIPVEPGLLHILLDQFPVALTLVQSGFDILHMCDA